MFGDLRLDIILYVVLFLIAAVVLLPLLRHEPVDRPVLIVIVGFFTTILGMLARFKKRKKEKKSKGEKENGT